MQYLAVTCSVVICMAGSQIFYLIPFYLYYPALLCHSEDSGTVKECSRQEACQQDTITHVSQSYEFDASSPNTLKNWMTELDLICMEPVYVGLMGSISFVSFAVGSIFFTKQAHKYGRHPVIFFSALCTPVSLIFLVCASKHIGIFGIYLVMGFLGLSYNPRCSTAYLYGAEMLPKPLRIRFNAAVFFFDGSMTILAPVFFYYFGNQNAIFFVFALIMSVALVCFKFLLPESPSFLLSKGDFEGYRKCMARILANTDLATCESELDANEFNLKFGGD
jgi:MFS family permease